MQPFVSQSLGAFRPPVAFVVSRIMVYNIACSTLHVKGAGEIYFASSQAHDPGRRTRASTSTAARHSRHPSSPNVAT
jgi:hypothetical protein